MDTLSVSPMATARKRRPNTPRRLATPGQTPPHALETRGDGTTGVEPLTELPARRTRGETDVIRRHEPFAPSMAPMRNGEFRFL